MPAAAAAMRDQYLVFGQPLIEEPEIAEVVDSLRRRWIGTGPKVKRFESMLAEYTGASQVRCLNSCTAAMHLGLLAAGVGPGDEVITSPLTFAATASAILYTGATPVFVDVDRRTQNIDPERVARAVTGRTRAIVPVHMCGRPCDLDALHAIAAEHGLLVLEDAAHALGAEYRGRRIGQVSHLTCFSFYATKNIVTGEGGAVATDNAEWAAEIEVRSLHGLTQGAWQRYAATDRRNYAVVQLGYKYNMMDLQAALGIHQLPRITAYQAVRERLWQQYDDLLAGLPLQVPAPVERDVVHARHLYTVMLDLERVGPREQVQAALHRQNIGTGVHFIALHLHPHFASVLRHTRGDFPDAEWISERTLSLPLSAALQPDDVEDVITALRTVFSPAVTLAGRTSRPARARDRAASRVRRPR
jgi:dTDP-4-amino-4,6-dideoxygalactose transaminase